MEALKSANLLKSLTLNALIVGESGTGKETLARFILPDAKIVQGNNFQEVLSLIGSNEEIIIKNFDKISSFKILKTEIEKYKTRVIATSKIELLDKITNDFFALTVTLPPLIERKEDVELLIEKFFKEVSAIFGESSDVSLKDLNIDLSNNCHSLRKSIYIKYLIDSLGEDDVMSVMEEFLSKKLGGKNDYRDQLYLFDVPMLRCGFKKFNSQLNMSEKFGLNRNTLRKKINDYKDNYKLQ